MAQDIRPVLDVLATLGEGPCWDGEKKVLYWVDIVEKRVHVYQPEQDMDRAIPVGQYVGAVVPDRSGRLVCAMENGFYVLNPHNGEWAFLTDPETDVPANRFNDGKCDAAGRFWAGTMSLTEKEKAGSLYCLRPDLRCEKKLANVSISNGLAWSPDQRTFYYIDTPTRQVAVYDFDPETGEIGDRRSALDLSGYAGLPDGMTVDEEGMLWIAFWNGGNVSRFHPGNGVLLEKIALPVSQVTSCAFGGERLDELYITTARVGLDGARLAEEPLAGALFKVGTNTRGMPANPFAGTNMESLFGRRDGAG